MSSLKVANIKNLEIELDRVNSRNPEITNIKKDKRLSLN